jgi:hypothetical protein
MRDKFSDVNSAIIAASASLPDLEPLEDWSDAADEFAASPSVHSYAQLTLASRNLSSNLREVGIKVAPDRLAMSADPQKAEDVQVNDYIRRRYGER